ncbi:hypothetical protein CMV_026284 [Castanea mollissima]|uniref:Leucine-rich repeat-containing N-terminal plant-type domain-containing protein n=1 Tax=Castanea mollissima TaxID=60419 RepID=A0A8J4VG04_9ROSI|nr:hypothetical protein CMV_026284 [Castanea mollissima]
MERVLLLLICFLLLSQPNNCSSSFSFNSSTPLCHSHQSSALLHFRNSFSVGDSNGNCHYPPKNLWKMGTDCCGWDGVTCDTMTGHVIAVDLSCSRLQGPIHPNTTLFSLRHLQRLNLAYNYFNASTISSKFGGFANLTHLNLTMSFFAGNVPSEISHLSKLVSLDLSFNFGMLRIEMPSLKRLVQNLTHLTELVLDDVDMSSVPPKSFMNLSSSLTSLRLSECGLKGRFPDNIFHLPNLQLFDVDYNDNLTGSLPTYNWSTPLKSLRLSRTEFRIDLPNLISNLKSLKELYLRGCNFIGSYPTFLPNLTQITSLDLSENNFGGQIPWSLLNFDELTYLHLSFNNFMGQLPNISSLNSSSNSQPVSQIPSKLFSLSLSDNLLNGTIPSWLYDIPSLLYLSLKNNQFTGQIEEFQHYSLNFLDLSNNNLNGHLPNSIAKLVNLSDLHISFNNLSGNVEPNMFSKLKSLIVVDLSHNNLQGHLPISISKLVSLSSLDISFNNLSGSVEPNIFTKLKSLEYVDLSHNRLLSFHTYSYNIVDYTLPNLRSLVLSSCNISEFPYFLKSMENLCALDLSNNQINGSIPTWLLEVKMDSLGYLNLSYNSLARIEHLPWKNLQALDLHSNLLEGPLPVPPLYTYFFSVSRNNLTGEIPLLICNLSLVGYLDLSYNHLSNMIPPCLGNLSQTSFNNPTLCSGGCDASVPLDDSNGYKNHSIPNHTLKWLGRGLLSCADIVSIATRDGIIETKKDNVFVTVVTSIQYRALSATPEHRSNPMSLMFLDHLKMRTTLGRLAVNSYRNASLTSRGQAMMKISDPNVLTGTALWLWSAPKLQFEHNELLNLFAFTKGNMPLCNLGHGHAVMELVEKCHYPKRHYKKGDSKSKMLPKYFQIGMVIESASDFFTGRLTRKEREGTIAAELLSDCTLADYSEKKNKFNPNVSHMGSFHLHMRRN